jgi:hypothetical protein
MNAQEKDVADAIHWILMTALHDQRLLAVKGSLLREYGEDNDVVTLQDRGCDKEKLLNVLAFTKLLPDRYPPIFAEELRSLADDIDGKGGVLTRMRKYDPSYSLPLIEDRQTDYEETNVWLPIAARLYLGSELEQDLEKKAELYRKLARMCTERKIPTRKTFRKLAYLWPLAYVNHCCNGLPHFTLVSNLLLFIKVDKGPRQLRDAFRVVEHQNPEILAMFVFATDWLQDAIISG